MEIPKSKKAFAHAAAACEYLALSFKEPDETLVGALLSDEWVEFGDGMDSALELGLPDDWAFDLDEETPVAVDGEGGVVAYIEALRIEAGRLFGDTLETSEPMAVPRESIALGLDVDETAKTLAELYASAGFAQDEVGGDGDVEPLDHISTEMNYLAYLARIAAGEGEPGGGLDEASLPGGSAKAAYKEFAKQHLAGWAPHFAEAVVALTKSPYYRAAGQVLAAFLKK